MNIVLYDEHPVQLDGVKKYLHKKNNFQVIGAFVCKTEFTRCLTNNKVHIIIAEYLCQDATGLVWINQIKKKHPNSKIILYTSSYTLTEDIYFKAAGIDAIVKKKSSLQNLYKTISSLSETDDTEATVLQKIKGLTKKEKSIINLMTEGLTSHEIAETIQCSTHTINNQKNHLIKKFGCKTSTELIAKLFRLGFLVI